MTKEQVFVKALEKRISWLQAADILGVTPRHMRRIRWSVERYGMDILKDGRPGSRRKRIPGATIKELCRLKRELYADFSIRHFHEFATEKHGLKLSYTMARAVLQAAGLAEKAGSTVQASYSGAPPSAAPHKQNGHSTDIFNCLWGGLD